MSIYLTFFHSFLSLLSFFFISNTKVQTGWTCRVHSTITLPSPSLSVPPFVLSFSYSPSSSSSKSLDCHFIYNQLPVLSFGLFIFIPLPFCSRHIEWWMLCWFQEEPFLPFLLLVLPSLQLFCLSLLAPRSSLSSTVLSFHSFNCSAFSSLFFRSFAV